MAKVLMKGNEAFAEACVRAGCRYFRGYPITRPTEVRADLSCRLSDGVGQVIQTVPEVAGRTRISGATAAVARALQIHSAPGCAITHEVMRSL